jgi:2-polyprenyl-6-hydroxyphenyl methylase/3-demethylubiquinone-9 3-methyltransferase
MGAADNTKENRFAFGKNWQNFTSQNLNETRIAEAEKSLLDFLNLSTLEGLTFLDIGCGSGLFSLAAYRLKAAKIFSFDYDENSVSSCQSLHQMAGSPSHWTVCQGSVLDTKFLSTLPPADIVYSWGVLHHTGRMWQAVRNAAGLMKPGGLFYLALYNKVERFTVDSQGRLGTSAFWQWEKKMYNNLPLFLQRIVDYGALLSVWGVLLLRFKNPLSYSRSYYQKRGMNLLTDIRDWLGGYPYEFASVEEVTRFCAQELKLTLKNVKKTDGFGNNEFLFASISAPSK